MILKRGLVLLFLLFLGSCTTDDPVDCEEHPLDEACYVTYDEVKGNLVWAEEFDYTGYPDPEIWNYDLGAGGWGNNEIQTYTDSIANAEVKDGMLHIRALKQEQRGMPFYTSARLKTRFKADFLYGRIEVKAKLPNMLGPWSAIWMKGTHEVYGGWPESGEIDIMEYAFNKYPTQIKGTLHSEKYNHMKGNQRGEAYHVGDVTEFHVYAIDWEPNVIRFYVDDELYFIVRNLALDSIENWEAWPYDQQMYLLLNIAVGGSWGGEVIEIEDEALMQVDWIRVWDLHLDPMEDDEAPEVPRDFSYVKTHEGYRVSWRPSSDNYAIHHYDVYVDGELVSSDFRISTVLDLEENETYGISIVGVDYAGNESDALNAQIHTE